MNEVNTKVLQSLLDSVKVIVDKHNAKIKERRKRGELFNIFDVLGLDSDEVRCHSAFIGELLNVNGNHGLGSSFLDAFISATGIEKLGLNTDAENCKTDKEFYVGRVTEEEGGRVDILIHSESEKKAIIIENKIYASDGHNQLIRYNEYGNNHYGNNFIVLYLTLDGSEPYETSTKNKQGEICKYQCISYRKDILSWLDRCIELSAEKPLIREVIVQYKNLILSLTNQFMDIKVHQEFLDLITDKKNIQGIANILQSRDDFYGECFVKYLFPQLEDVAKKNGLLFSYKYIIDPHGPDLYMYFYHNEVSCPIIAFIFKHHIFKQLRWGLHHDSIRHIKTQSENDIPKKEDVKMQGKLDFFSRNPRKDGLFAFGWSYFREDLSNWENEQTIMKVINGEFADEVDRQIKNLFNYVNSDLSIKK